MTLHAAAPNRWRSSVMRYSLSGCSQAPRICGWKHKMYFLLCPGDASGLNSEVNGLKHFFFKKEEGEMNHSLQPHGQEWSVLFQLTSEAQSMQETAANGESSIWAPELRVLLAQLTPQPPWLTRNRAHLHYISLLSASDEREKCRRLPISHRH